MLIKQLIGSEKSRHLIFKIFSWRNYANETATGTPKSTYTMPGPPDPVKIVVPKPSLGVSVDASVIKQSSPVDEITKAISFDSIPGPISLKITNEMWKMIPILSTQITGGTVQYVLAIASLISWSGNTALYRRFFDHYGPVVRLHGPLGGDIVMVSRPEHLETVFKNEGPYPIRFSLDSLEKYRLQYRKMRHSGPLLMFGPEWEKFRKSVEQPLPLLLSQKIEAIEDCCDKLIERILYIKNKQEEVPGSFYTEIYKWCLECMCLVFLDKHLGFLDPCGLSSTSDPGILLDSLMGASLAIQRCEYGLHLWQFFPTPAWKALVKNCDSMEHILSKYIHVMQSIIRGKKEGETASKGVSSLLENILLKSGMMSEDAMTVMLDMMLVGINATAHTVAFLLYHLSKNPRCQVKLHNEIMQHPSRLTKENLSRMPYLQACIKETLRLKPAIPVLGRVLQNDVSIYNYHVPRGTYLLMMTCLSGWREEYFEDAHKFMPERWLNSTPDMENFAAIPYGYGPKACLGKELAEMQIGVLLTKIVRKFKIEYLYGDIKSTNRLWAAPKKKLRFRFALRH